MLAGLILERVSLNAEATVDQRRIASRALWFMGENRERSF
ncbi:hypothetical protein PYCH_03280 [Pyrococcus yayanosii CH1]|uniref:Uncharacterized protein n=1 Tax=Pyrococcus yayanosii (strain CH1 / JCM 16557) TaxID=529709 RepID=F8AGP9_PYRYC|nr:hypothetical protein PYCH_03280 [Pyrococcus yayanosii CH1]